MWVKQFTHFICNLLLPVLPIFTVHTCQRIASVIKSLVSISHIVILSYTWRRFGSLSHLLQKIGNCKIIITIQISYSLFWRLFPSVWRWIGCYQVEAPHLWFSFRWGYVTTVNITSVSIVYVSKAFLLSKTIVDLRWFRLK